jgi:hypothetical protein
MMSKAALALLALQFGAAVAGEVGASTCASEGCVDEAADVATMSLLQLKHDVQTKRDRGHYNPNRTYKREQHEGCGTARTPPSVLQKTTEWQYCNPDGSSYAYSYSADSDSGFATITSNNCPAHKFENNMPASFSDNCATLQDYKYTIPLTPVFRDETGNADSSASAAQSATDGRNYKARWVQGRTGISVGNAQISYPGTGKDYDEDGDAMRTEASTFDYCGGHSSPQNNAGTGGIYHFHGQPYCLDSDNSYNDDDVAADGAHSPLVAWAVDGFPVYGVFGDNGALPTNLDECNGHSGDSGANGGYHYHITGYKGQYSVLYGPSAGSKVNYPYGGDSPKFTDAKYYKPYIVGCFRGCVPDEVDWADFQMEDYATCVAGATAAPEGQLTLADAGFSVQTSDFNIDEDLWTSASGSECSDSYFETTTHTMTTTMAATTTAAATTTTAGTCKSWCGTGRRRKFCSKSQCKGCAACN